MSHTVDCETGGSTSTTTTSRPAAATTTTQSSDYGPEELVMDLIQHVSKFGSYPQVGFCVLVCMTLIALIMGSRIELLIGDAVCCFLLVKFALLERKPMALRPLLLPAAVICAVCWINQITSRSPIAGRLMATASVWAWFFTVSTCGFVLRRAGVSHGDDHQD